MPPKIKITKNEIVETAFNLLRKNGESAINARSVANALECSTQPVFSNFKTMDKLREEVIKVAYESYLGFIKREVDNEKYPRYKAFGMAYIRFAKEESELFKLLFMRDRRSEDTTLSTTDFEQSVQMIMNANGVTYEKAKLIHTEIWIFVHGIATILVTSFLNIEWDDVSDMVTDAYRGIMARHLSEENNDSN